MKLSLTLLLTSALLLQVSCATMFNSGSQSIRAMSTDSKKVKVIISTPDGSYDSELPTTIVTKPSTFKKVSIKINDDCYEPSKTEVSEGITLSFWANLLNMYGFLIDPLTGYMWTYDSQVQVKAIQKNSCKKPNA